MKTASLICLLASFVCLAADPASNGLLKFSPGQSWKLEETMAMEGMPLNRSTLEYKVAKVFPDGSAIVKWKAIKAESGPSVEKLTAQKSPMLNREFQTLLTPAGESYQIQGKAGDSKSIKAAAQMKDADPLPASPLAVGEKKEVSWDDQKWSVTRLPDDQVNGKTCAVYEAKLGSISRNVCIDLSAGALMRRKILQSGAQITVLRK
jgi:hypothetical protein